MSRTLHRGLGVIALLAAATFFAAPAHGQVPEKVAQKALKVASKASLKTLGTTLKNTLAVFLLQLKVFEDQVKMSGYEQSELTALLDELCAMQAGVLAAVEQASADMQEAKLSALAPLDADDLEGIFPAGFYEGDGGTLEKNANVGLTFRIKPPLTRRVKVTNEITSSNSLAPLTIDVLVGASHLGVLDDGVLYVAGTAESGMVNVQIFGPQFQVADDKATVASLRWQYTAYLPETSYGVAVRQGTGSFVSHAISVR